MKTLEEIAAERAIEFSLWTMSGECDYICTDEDHWQHEGSGVSTEELYEIFLKEKNNGE